MKKRIKVMSCVLTAAVVTSALPFAVYADNGTEKIRIVVENNTFTGDNAAWTGTLVDKWVELKKDSTAVTLFKELMSEEGFTQTGADTGYITEINGVSAEGMGGWMIGFDDWYGNGGITAFKESDGTLENGDELFFSYSMDWGVDLGSDFNNTSTKLKSLEADSGDIESVDDSTYSLTLPEGVQSVKLTPVAENKNYRYKIYKDDYTPDEDNDYKRTEDISVSDGDKLYIGVGHASWHSWMPDGVSETVYTVNVSAQEAEHSDEQPEESVPAESSEESISQSSEDISASVSTDLIIEEVTEQIKSNDYLVPGYEWELMTLSRLDSLDKDEKDEYMEKLNAYISDNPPVNATDYAKYSIVADSFGPDYSGFYDDEYTDTYSDPDFAQKQGINGAVYALIALNAVPREKDRQASAEKLVDYILSSQLDDGGWTFYGDEYDPDMTGMVIQSLAPYYNNKTDEKITEAVDKAISLLSEVQNENGTYSSYGSENCESTAQVVTALSSVGIDADKDERFIKNGVSALAGLKSFYNTGEGTFSHTAGAEANKYSTAQAFYALCAYYRFSNGMTILYDMSDIISESNQTESPDEPENSAAEISEQPEASVITDDKEETGEVSGIIENSESSSPAETADTADNVSESSVNSSDGTVATSDNSSGRVIAFMIIIAMSALVAVALKKDRNKDLS